MAKRDWRTALGALLGLAEANCVAPVGLSRLARASRTCRAPQSPLRSAHSGCALAAAERVGRPRRGELVILAPPRESSRPRGRRAQAANERRHDDDNDQEERSTRSQSPRRSDATQQAGRLDNGRFQTSARGSLDCARRELARMRPAAVTKTSPCFCLPACPPAGRPTDLADAVAARRNWQCFPYLARATEPTARPPVRPSAAP